MSAGDWTAIAVVSAAALWAGWRLWRWLRPPPGGPGCGCDHCPR